MYYYASAFIFIQSDFMETLYFLYSRISWKRFTSGASGYMIKTCMTDKIMKGQKE